MEAQGREEGAWAASLLAWLFELLAESFQACAHLTRPWGAQDR